MSGQRRALLLGPPVVALVAGAAALAWLSRPPVGAGPAPSARAAGACDARPVGQPGPGAWWNERQEIDPSGALTGWRLRVGTGRERAIELRLPVESSVAGPVDGIVVVASDDGARSTLRLVSPKEGCAWLVADVDAVIRRAVRLPGGDLAAHLLERASRRDLGVWRFAADGAPGQAPLQILEPVGDRLLAAAAIDRVWTTDLRPAVDGGRLAVQSCGERHCVTRIVDLGTTGTGPDVVIDVRQGASIGLTADGLVTWGACDGLPCGILLAPPAAASHLVVDSVVAAALTASGRLVATVVDGDGERNLAIDLRTGDRVRLPGGTAALRPVGTGPSVGAGLEVGRDEVAVGADGSLTPLAAGPEVTP